MSTRTPESNRFEISGKKKYGKKFWKVTLFFTPEVSLTLTCASGLFSPEDLFLVNNSRQVDVRSLTDPKTGPKIFLSYQKSSTESDE